MEYFLECYVRKCKELGSGNVRIIKNPEEAFKVNSEGILEDERAVISGTLSKVPRGWRVGKFVPKESGVTGEEEAMDTEEIVFHLLTRHYL